MRDALEAVIKNSRVGFAPVLEMAHLVRTKWISVQVINKYTKLGIHQLNGIFILASVFLLGCQGPFQVLPRFPAKDLKYPPPSFPCIWDMFLPSAASLHHRSPLKVLVNE